MKNDNKLILGDCQKFRRLPETRNEFLHRCLDSFFSPWAVGDESKRNQKSVSELIEKAKTSEDFISGVLDCEQLKMTQLYAELAKDSGRYIDILLRDYKWSEGLTDGGAVYIGRDRMKVGISTGGGDGKFYVKFCKKEEFNTCLLDFVTDIDGIFHVYNGLRSILTGEEGVLFTLQGRYGIYSGNGFVVFEEWD